MNNSLPLAGLRVLDFSHAAAGPFASMFLGDMGAEVIKIEKINSGDGARWMGVPFPTASGRESDYSIGLNRNKKSLAIDLSAPEGRQILREIAAKSDIVVQNFRPGVLDRMGLGFDDLRKLRPNLVFCSISAFGPEGPWAGRPANDIIMQSISGLMGITGEVGGGPVRIGAPISDYATGLFALSGILAALYKREAHPDGQHIEISMLEASFNMMANYIPSVAGLGSKVPRVGRGHATIVPYQAFQCSDGEYVMVGAFTRGFWEGLAKVLEHPEWLQDERYSSNGRRLKNRESLIATMSEIFATKPRAHWMQLLEAADVPVGPVLDLHDAIETEQAKFYGSIADIHSGEFTYKVARSPFRVARWGETPMSPPPVIGGNTDAVLRDLVELSAPQIEDLKAKGVI